LLAISDRALVRAETVVAISVYRRACSTQLLEYDEK
jgi:hypothetical protein